MDRYDSWDGFCGDVFATLGKAGSYLQPLYAAGGMALLAVIVSMLGFGPFVFMTWLLGFLVTPLGWIVVAVFGALAVPMLKLLFSERRTLQPVLKRLQEAKSPYERIEKDRSLAERRQLIDSLFKWVVHGGAFPNF